MVLWEIFDSKNGQSHYSIRVKQTHCGECRVFADTLAWIHVYIKQVFTHTRTRSEACFREIRSLFPFRRGNGGTRQFD